MEGLRRLGLLVLDDDARPETDLVDRDLGHVDGRQLAEPLVELAEARLDGLLPLESRLVLTVLAEVAHLDGTANLVGQRDIELVLQARGFHRQLFLQFFNHGSGGCDGKYGTPGLVSRALSMECMSNRPKKQLSLPGNRCVPRGTSVSRE